MSAAVRWRDPTGLLWTAMLTHDGYGPHFSVQGNGRPPTDDEVMEATLAHDNGRWAPRDYTLKEITALRVELGQSLNPNVRQFVPPAKYDIIAQAVARHRDTSS